MKRSGALLLIFTFFLNLYSVDFDPDESYCRFQKGHFAGFSILPVHEGRNTLLELSLFGTFTFDSFAFGVHAPIRFLLSNKDGVDTTGKVFPKDDWNEARDWVKLLKFFQYGHKHDLFYFYFGEHRNRYMGNGTILGAYHNTLKLNFPKRGVNIGVNTDYAGIDFFMDDVTPPNVIGGRTYFKPLSFFDKQSYWNNLELGFTFLGDVFTPYRIVSELYDSVPRRTVDEIYTYVAGFDIGFRFFTSEYYQVKFYTDWNKIKDAGSGFHLGLKHVADLPTIIPMRILSTWEYKAMQSNYAPSYFNTFYDIQREHYRDGMTKTRFLSDPSRKGSGWNHGYYFDLVYDITGLFSIGGSFGHNRIYSNDLNSKFNNIEINAFINTILFKRIGADFTITFEDINEGALKDEPFYRLSVYYLLSDFATLGFSTRSAWYLRYRGEGVNFESYYKNTAFYSFGFYGTLRF